MDLTDYQITIARQPHLDAKRGLSPIVDGFGAGYPVARPRRGIHPYLAHRERLRAERHLAESEREYGQTV